MTLDRDRLSGRSASEGQNWRRLSHRVIWVDFAILLVSSVPGSLSLWLTPSAGALWFPVTVSVIGILGAIGDAMRWVSTSYLVTDIEVQRRSGIFIRRTRSARRDRIRSIELQAKLRHRLTGMRIVSIGAGQQNSAREAAFKLNALSKAEAEKLRLELLGAANNLRTAEDRVEKHLAQSSRPNYGSSEPGVEVLERFQARWVFYNIFTIWAYFMAAGLAFGTNWLLAPFGVDLLGMATDVVSRFEVGWVTLSVIVLLAGGAVGAIALGLSFIVTNWNFELARTESGPGTFLRTKRGLFSTKEVNRDEARIRGVTIDEPLVWRWIGMADTNVLTTGLSLSSNEEATTLIPRGPISVAHRVAVDVVGDAYAACTRLPRHPTAALRRRLFWATSVTAGMIALVAVPIWNGLLPDWVLWVTIGLWPFALLASYIAYAALGHGVHGDYLLTRAGLVNRSTAVLRRDAVSTVTVSQSVLQRRLGLSTVAFMTAAGWGAYDAPDVAADQAFGFARDAAPGLMDPFLERLHSDE